MDDITLPSTPIYFMKRNLYFSYITGGVLVAPWLGAGSGTSSVRPSGVMRYSRAVTLTHNADIRSMTGSTTYSSGASSTFVP
jgi:hypothetical protein